MTRPTSDNPATVLRSALAGPFPALRAIALRLIQRALRRGPTIGAAAESLGLPRRALERLRADFPEIDKPPQK